MNHLRLLVCSLAGAMALAPGAVGAQTAAAAYGVGPHGFDWAVGTWSCTNSVPSPMGGPRKTTLTVVRTSNGTFYRTVGATFDNSWYNVYVPKTKSWVSPFIINDGTYGTESTSMTGAKMVWVGTAVDGSSGKTMRVRDTNVMSADKYTDLGEYMSGGTWKPQYDVTCQRT